MQLKLLWKSATAPWVFLYLALALIVTQFGGTNALSRIAALRAMTEGRELHIDNYKDWTMDWALSPNGHYYSNKAPGGALLGLPVFAITDLPLQAIAKKESIDEKGRLPAPGYLQVTLLVLFTQLLPFALLVAFLASKLPTPANHFFAIAALLGNTAAVYMNSYFGHGLAAVLFLACFYFWVERRYATSAFFFGLAALTDYGAMFAAPAFLLATLMRERSLAPIARISLGALAPATVWCWYHYLAFENIFTVATRYTNPTQMYELPEQMRLGGLIPLPSMDVVRKLLWGPERGTLHTQPWVLAAVALPLAHLWRARWIPGAYTFMALALFSLLAMNASFGGWNGGYAVGPRYLCLLFPALAYFVAVHWVQFRRWERSVLWLALAVAVAFRIYIFPFSNLAPEENLWTYHSRLYISSEKATPWVRLAIAAVLCGFAALIAIRRSRSLNERS